jgi:hypothetical protein
VSSHNACSRCHRAGATLQAGGDVGLVHEACFDRWDRHQEAAELEAVSLFHDLPPQPAPRPPPPRRLYSRRVRAIAAAVEACHA